MPELRNARHELFAVLVARSQDTPAQAYSKAGFKPKSLLVASAAATRLLKNVLVAGRVAELKRAWAERSGYETTDVIRWLGAISGFDIRRVASWKTIGKGRNKRVEITLLDSDKIDDQTACAIRGFKITPTGFEAILRDTAAPKLIGEHLGMFQGESAGAGPPPPQGGLVNNGTMVFVDAPRRETLEEWQARIDARAKLIEAKPGGAGK